MKGRNAGFVLAVLVAGLCPDVARAIDIKVSVKWMWSKDGAVRPGDLSISKSNGTPFACDENASNQAFLDRIAYANAILARSGRGIRFTVEFDTLIAPSAVATTCGDFGTPRFANACAAATTCPVTTPGVVVISELMVNPEMVYDQDGEWFELQNTTASPVNLNGWTVRDNGSDVFTITALTLPANGRLLFGRRNDYYTNGNLTFDQAYGVAFTLDDPGDEIVLKNSSGVTIDSVAYNSTWTAAWDADSGGIRGGRSLCLKSITRDNNCPDAWALSTAPYWKEWTSVGSHCQDEVQAAASADPATWKWDSDALNIYMMAMCSGGVSGTTKMGHVTMSIGQNEAGGWVRPFHELGHALGICHTHGCFTWNPKPCFCDPARNVDLDDCLADTPLDLNRDYDLSTPAPLADSLAVKNFGVAYDLLECDQKQRVLDVVFNIMAYHRDNDVGYPSTTVTPALICDPEAYAAIPCSTPASALPNACRHRLSPDQLDRIMDFCNILFRRARDIPGQTGGFASGLTYFVDAGFTACPAWCASTDSKPWECQTGSSIVPHQSLGLALAAAEAEAGRDHLILLRPGVYGGAITIDQQVEIRATRGDATIGN